MADQSGNGAQAPQAGPRFSVLAQYTKDLSFENPNAPRTLGPQQASPNISIQINVNARQLAPTDYEVSLMLEGGAGQGADTMFKFELNYAGVFRVENFPPDQVQPVVMIEGPRFCSRSRARSSRMRCGAGLIRRSLSTRSIFTRSICNDWRRPAASSSNRRPDLSRADDVRSGQAAPDSATRSHPR